MATLGNVCHFLNGGTPSKEVSSYFEGDIPWITSADIVGPIAGEARSFITEEAIKKSATNKVATGTVLLVTRTGVGKVAIAGRDLCFSQDITALIPDSAKLDGGYLVQYLRTKQTHFERRARGATIKGITRDVVADLAIPLPPIPEQIRIAAILDKVDALRVKRREALAQLDSLTQAIFIEMFGDPVRGDGRYPLSNIEEIAAPEKYSIVDGPFGSSMKPDDYREFGIPVIRIANITKGGEFSKKNLLYIDKPLFEKLKRSSIKPFDVLVSRVGTIGNTCVFPDGIGDALLSTTGVCKITPDRRRILPEFLHQAILQPAFRGCK